MNLDLLLRVAHGKNPKKSDIFLVHIFPLSFAAIYFYLKQAELAAWHPIQVIAYFLICWDVMGGVVANMTMSSKQHWMQQTLLSQLIFLIGHFLHPMVLYLLFDFAFFPIAGIYLYVLITGIILLYLEEEINRPVSLMAALIGIIIFYPLLKLPGLEWFSAAYIMKLMVGFSMKISK